jgi:hypothetical protein
MKKLVLAAALAAAGLIGAAHAAPLLQIVDTGGALASAANQEAIGDNGGAAYGNGPTAGASNGPGLPTINGGWPAGAGFAVDTGPAPGAGFSGISGWDASYLKLTKAANVTFQFMGKGDASDHNIFQVDTGAGMTTIWDNQSALNGTCGVTGTTPNCPFSGSQQTFAFNAGLIAFQFVNLTHGGIANNIGVNPSPDKSPFGAGYFLGIDPYLAAGAFQNTGTVAYAGFTDQPLLTVGGDHDYEDLVVRISTVPEPGTALLLGAGLIGLAGLRRRKV